MSDPEPYKAGRGLGCVDAGETDSVSGMEVSGTSGARKLGRGKSEKLGS